MTHDMAFYFMSNGCGVQRMLHRTEHLDFSPDPLFFFAVDHLSLDKDELCLSSAFPLVAFKPVSPVSHKSVVPSRELLGGDRNNAFYKYFVLFSPHPPQEVYPTFLQVFCSVGEEG